MQNQTIVSIRSLQKKYGQNDVLHGIDMEISSGQIIGYIGPNGAGKSTTVKILCGLISDFQGDVSIFGMDLRTQTMEIKKKVGYIPENASLYESLTPLEFMEFIGEMRGMTTDQTRQKAEALMNIFEMKPNINQRISTFSKGMRLKYSEGLIKDGVIIAGEDEKAVFSALGLPYPLPPDREIVEGKPVWMSNQ